MTKYVCCFSGGKDSTAMLIHILRDMQYQTDGSFYPEATIFDCEKQFWKKHQNELRNKRMEARKKYNKR